MSRPGGPTVAIAFHSGHGHTAVIAEAVARGAADAIVFGAATYMGTASAAFHAFAQAGSKRWFHIATAEHLGARVARQAAIFRAGRDALAA
ncbi:hypothetical protein ABZT17_08510 [Streptomyces sp. NPDC005648]|uniref:hypothetical protein n=1 Tax=Streptomyces sp. NPDC005648 TaxID=3157044 RepID=UPI0033A79872